MNIERCSVRINRKAYGYNFITINTSNLISAFKNLSNKGFPLYLFLVPNQNGYYKTFFADEAKTRCGFTDEELEAATNELIEKRYLVENGSTYEFYEVPLAKTETEEKERKLTALDF